MKLRCFGLSERAGRTTNDDTFCSGDDLPVYAVADGIGARAGASVASSIAIRSLTTRVANLGPDDRLDEGQLRDTIVAVNADVMAAGANDPALSGLGTTLSAIVVGPGGSRIIHVGDSRVYLVRDGEISRLTREHTVANDLVEMKRLDPADVEQHPLRSMLSRFLGSPTDAVPDIESLSLQAGDILVLATDGLTAVLSEADILQCCRRELPNGPEALCRRLTTEALKRTPADNVTVVTLEAMADGSGERPAQHV
jgi:protein phosphatase